MRTNHIGKVIAIGLLFIAPIERAIAGDRVITDLIPADSLVVYTAKPYTFLEPASQPAGATDAPSMGAWLSTFLSFLNASGVIPAEGQVFADIATAFPLLGRYEHAFVLLDISSHAIPTTSETSGFDSSPSLRLEHLEAAVIFQSKDQEQSVIDYLKRVTSRYTNNEVATMTDEKIDGVSFQRLRDERLPGWAIWEWGRLDDYFVIAFGAGAFKSVADAYSGKAPSLSHDKWYRAASIKTKGDRALAQWFISLSRLKDQLGDAAAERNERVIAALEVDNMTHDLWTVGLEGKALSCYRCYRRNNVDVVRSYSDPQNLPAHHMRIVPEQARHFAVINAPTDWLFDNIPRAWLAAQSEHRAQTWERIWRSLEQETGTDIDGNLLRHLGNEIVVFDYPPHPLRIPLAMTMAIEIDDYKAVKTSLDALLSAWGQYVDERAERKGTTLLRIKVRQDADGIWFLQAGILGPALKVTKHYVVISWSPQALKDALHYIETDKPPAISTSRPAASQK